MHNLPMVRDGLSRYLDSQAGEFEVKDRTDDKVTLRSPDSMLEITAMKQVPGMFSVVWEVPRSAEGYASGHTTRPTEELRQMFDLSSASPRFRHRVRDAVSKLILTHYAQ